MLTSVWQSLSPYPDIYSTNLASLNSTEFICGAFVPAKQEQRILKYNTLQNEWTEYLQLPGKSSFYAYPLCLHRKHNILYIGVGHDRLVKFNIDTNEYKEIHLPDNIGVGQSLLIDDDIHLIGGYKNTHSILQQNQTKSKMLSRYCDQLGSCNNHTIYSSKTDTIYTFGGGYNYADRSISNTIYSYNIGTNKHKSIDLKMPEALAGFGSIMTKDGKFVITFGGYNGRKKVDDIYIFDMEKMNVRKSSIVCPKTSDYYAILMIDYTKQIMIVYGYIRWSLKQIDRIISFPCNDIINLIVKWYAEEMIYLQERYGSYMQKSLWRISLSKILQ